VGPLPSVTKLEAAKRQLCTAIRLFFADDDAIAVCTLAFAALEIFETRPKEEPRPFEGRFRLFDVFKQGFPNLTNREIWKKLHHARNFFKHGGPLTKSIVFVEQSNDAVLFLACSNCMALADHDHPPEVDAFLVWYMTTQAVTGLPERDNLFPGMRTASRSEQKRFGTQLVADAIAGRLPYRPSVIFEAQ
jgi:hypothetical protein